jgi:hypothetical protein
MPSSKKRSQKTKTKNKVEEVPSLEAFHKLKAISVTERGWMNSTYGGPSSLNLIQTGQHGSHNDPMNVATFKVGDLYVSPSHPDIRPVFS